MSIESEFSTSMGRIDQNPNKELASRICQSKDAEAVKAIIAFLKKPTNDNLLFDALKVLEMVGESDAELARPAFEGIFPYLRHPATKVVWMAMSALSQVSQFYPQKTFDKLELIVSIMENGSVICRDKGFKMLTQLYTHQKFREVVVALMEEQLLLAPDNQLGQYAEKWMEVAEKHHFKNIRRALEARANELHNPGHQKRMIKNLKKLNKLVG